GAPLVSVNVVVSGTLRGAATGPRGEFIITNLPARRVTLVAKMIGYEPVTQEVVVRPGETVTVRFELQPSFFEAQQVVVTATRTEKLLKDVPVVTEVVPHTEIEEKGAVDLAEALEDRPGIVIEANSSGGKILRMNGIDNKRILVLVDGVPVTGRVQDRVELNLIDADDVDHVEIVKGPGSALYGSEAMGGVINVVTRGISDHLQLSASTRVGSNGLFNGNAAFSNRTKGIGYMLLVNHTREGEGKTSSEIDIEDFRTTLARGKVQRAWTTGQVELSGSIKNSNQQSTLETYRGAKDTETDVRNWGSALRIRQKLARNVNLKANLYASGNFRTYKSVPQGMPMMASIDTTTEDLLGLRSNMEWRAHDAVNLVLGYDFADQSYESDRIGREISRKQHGLFGQAELKPISKATLVLGARYDKVTGLTGQWSPRISAMLEPTADLKLRATWGAGFRAPSFVEMYSHFVIPIPGHPILLEGNPDLKPETSTGYNVGVEYFWNTRILVNATFYRNDFKDLIADTWRQYGSVLSYRNVDRATFTTFELQTKLFLLDNLTASLSYNTTTVTENDEKAASLGIPPHTATLRVHWRLLKNRLRLSLREQFFSKTEISQIVQLPSGGYATETATRAAYGLLDATATYQLSRVLAVRAGVINATDVTDRTFGPWYGRRFFVGLKTTL
ncbi:MAG: TonB-dependent receptor, partial [Calditrichaeota bacterium]|nr:TonB-dependent receptor [Calditrichota bacterium]